MCANRPPGREDDGRIRDYRSIPLWRDVPPEVWNDWRWQLRHRIQTPEELAQVVDLTVEELEAVRASMGAFRLGITPYYATLMDPVDRDDPLRLLGVPTAAELDVRPEEVLDPLAEEVDSPVPGLTHRYPDRVLLLATDLCAVYCRHCTRRHHTGRLRPAPLAQIDRCLDYIRGRPEIRDVLISGGDPWVLGERRLEYILHGLRSIPHVEIIRFGTRMPVVCPQRVTPELCRLLRRYHPVYVNTHFNHPRELTPEAVAACERLADAGVPVGNQTVLLRGVNDCPVVMRELMHRLLRARVRPYYLYQCDLSPGLARFRTTIQRGLEIMETLRGHTSGLAVPTYVVDAPGGGGKIPLSPNYVVSMSEDRVILRNYEGVLVAYPQPRPSPPEAVCRLCGSDHAAVHQGVAGLFRGGAASLEPVHLARRQRRAAWRMAGSAVAGSGAGEAALAANGGAKTNGRARLAGRHRSSEGNSSSDGNRPAGGAGGGFRLPLPVLQSGGLGPRPGS
ncbi:MAG: lysine 2,3-aminomutase [Clostridia bacterium]|nr:lysine 2,3-aminomutase [Clostridia bacterium]